MQFTNVALTAMLMVVVRSAPAEDSSLMTSATQCTVTGFTGTSCSGTHGDSIIVGTGDVCIGTKTRQSYYVSPGCAHLYRADFVETGCGALEPDVSTGPGCHNFSEKPHPQSIRVVNKA